MHESSNNSANPTRLVGALIAGMTLLLAPVLADPVTECRANSRGDSVAHIECLENAIRRLSKDVVPPPSEALGAEQVLAKQRQEGSSPESLPVKVVAATYSKQGLGTFRLEDGKQWRETEKSPPQKRLQPSTVYSGRIERGTLGGYRLYIDGVRHMYKIERIE